MSIPGKISAWDERYPFIYLALRIVLGVILVFRGIFFITSIEPLFHLIRNSRLNELNMNMTLALFVCWAHLLGGTLIILGLLTKIAAWAHIPILLGAIVFINLNSSLSRSYSELLLSVFVLFLSSLFALGGGGKISMDSYVKGHLL